MLLTLFLKSYDFSDIDSKTLLVLSNDLRLVLLATALSDRVDLGESALVTELAYTAEPATKSLQECNFYFSTICYYVYITTTKTIFIVEA